MKNLISILLLSASLLVLTSCGKDGPLPPAPDPTATSFKVSLGHLSASCNRIAGTPYIPSYEAAVSSSVYMLENK